MRRLFLIIAAPLLSACVIGTITLYSLNQAFGQPTNLKRWLRQSQLYDNVVAGIIDQAKQKTAEQPGEASADEELSFDRPEFQAALQQAVTPAFVQQSVEDIIDGTYSWLQRKTDKPTYHVDLTGVKNAFAASIGDQARARLNTLPPCSIANQPATSDPFNITCRPPANISEPEIQKLISDITNNKDFLPANTITADTTELGSTTDTTPPTAEPAAPTAAKPSLPWYQQARQLPTVYGWTMRGPLVLGLLALALAVGIVFVTQTRRTGLRVLAMTGLTTGLMLILSAGISLAVFASAAQRSSSQQVTHFQQPVVRLLTYANNAVNYPILWWGIGVALAGLAGLGALYVTRSQAATVAPSPKSTKL
jgi:hypothetical protein